MRTNSALTIYNKYRVGTVDTYQRSVVPAVSWEARTAHQGTEDRNVNADTAIIYIPTLGTLEGYLSPKTWQALTNKAGFWTLQVGDVIVKGTHAEELVAGTYTLSNLKSTHDDVLVISSVDTYDMGSPNMWHWELGAK
jgi:hypothetical protein